MDIPAWLTSDNITVATAVGALFISIYNLITSRLSEKKYAPLLDLQKHQSQLQIQEHMKALQEEKAAKFKVAYEKHGNSSKLRISNNGKCDAHNVHLFVEKNSPVINSELEEFNANTSKISSMSSQKLIAATHMGTPTYETITIEWDDDEQKGKKETFRVKTY